MDGDLTLVPIGGRRRALLPVALLALAGCATTAGKQDKAVVSVSALNYADLAGRDVISVVNGPATVSPEPPVVAKPAGPSFYLMLPGEVYPSDVPLPSLYHALELSLQHRGYYSALAQVKAGLPLRIDYLLRVHYGARPWSNPVVRADQVTWGNDGLVGKRYKTRMASDLNFDSRQGLSEGEVNHLARLSLMMTGGASYGTDVKVGANNTANARAFIQDEQVGAAEGDGAQPPRDFGLVVIEAFKFADVKAMDTKAPCAWMIFIGVPTDPGEKLSELLAAMLKTAEPYYGGTTQGLQVFEVPAGKVDVGEPSEVREKAGDPDHRPSVNLH
jgi:hypothetical protein